MGGKRRRALERMRAEEAARKRAKQPPQPIEKPAERRTFKHVIPRIILTNPQSEEFRYLWVDEPGRHRVVFGFTSRENAETFVQNEKGRDNLHGEFLPTYLGYEELRDWLEDWQRANLHLYAVDCEDMSEVFMRAAEIHELIELLEGCKDTGDEIMGDFSMYTLIPRA